MIDNLKEFLFFRCICYFFDYFIMMNIIIFVNGCKIYYWNLEFDVVSDLFF